jgi:hypothetical protein
MERKSFFEAISPMQIHQITYLIKLVFFLNVLTIIFCKKLTLNRNNHVICRAQNEDKELLVSNLRLKIVKENIPIFEFRSELEKILLQSNTVDLNDAEIIFSDYLDLLKNYYYESYMRKANDMFGSAASNVTDTSLIKLDIMKVTCFSNCAWR